MIGNSSIEYYSIFSLDTHQPRTPSVPVTGLMYNTQGNNTGLKTNGSSKQNRLTTLFSEIEQIFIQLFLPVVIMQLHVLSTNIS